jgi:hypothetical protein
VAPEPVAELAAGRCPYRVAATRAPDGWSNEAQASHPTYRHYGDPQAQCEHDAGHEGPHRNGSLVWHDPPVVIVVPKPA